MAERPAPSRVVDIWPPSHFLGVTASVESSLGKAIRPLFFFGKVFKSRSLGAPSLSVCAQSAIFASRGLDVSVVHHGVWLHQKGLNWSLHIGCRSDIRGCYYIKRNGYKLNQKQLIAAHRAIISLWKEGNDIPDDWPS